MKLTRVIATVGTGLLAHDVPPLEFPERSTKPVIGKPFEPVANDSHTHNEVVAEIQAASRDDTTSSAAILVSDLGTVRMKRSRLDIFGFEAIPSGGGQRRALRREPVRD